jgi:hypothetical protein
MHKSDRLWGMNWKMLLFCLAALGPVGAAELTFTYKAPVGFTLTVDFTSGAMTLKDEWGGSLRKATLKKPEEVGTHVKKLLESIKAEAPDGEIAEGELHYVVTFVEGSEKTERKISGIRPPGEDYARDFLLNEDQLLVRLSNAQHFARHVNSFLLTDLLRGIADGYFFASHDALGMEFPSYFSVKGTTTLPYDFAGESYAQHMKAMEEKPLPIRAADAQSHVYRFTCMRSFHEGFCVVLEIMPDGTGHLTTKMETGRGGYEAGSLRLAGQMSVPKSSAEKFADWANTAGFWTLPRNDPEPPGLDGSRWIIEGVKKGKYHVIERWTPQAGTFARQFGEGMLKMAYWTVDNLY